MIRLLRRTSALGYVLALCVSAGLTTASFALTGATAGAEKQVRVRLVSEPTTFDWNIASTDAETPITMNIMEGLVEFDANMRITPMLAKSWTISPDQLTYTFKLQPDIKWSDGKKLTADDFAYSWQRLLAPFTAASYAYFLFAIEGAEEFNNGKNADFTKVGIKAIDRQIENALLVLKLQPHPLDQIDEGRAEEIDHQSREPGAWSMESGKTN